MDLKIDAEFIKAERQRRGWSQEQLAAAAGLGVRTIQRLESGSTSSSESAKSLAAVFEVPFSRLVSEQPKPFVSRKRLMVAGAALCAALGSSLLLISRANANDVAMAVVVRTDITGESRMNLEVNSGRQTEIRLEGDLRLILTPTIQKDGAIFLAAEAYAWDGSDFKLVGKPKLLMRQGEETRLKLSLLNGSSAHIGVTCKEAKL